MTVVALLDLRQTRRPVTLQDVTTCGIFNAQALGTLVVDATRDALSGIAGRTGACLYWYGRTATLDALQDLHQHGAHLPD